MMNEQQRAASLKAFAHAIDKAGGQVALAMVLQCSQARVSRILAGESVLDGEMAARIAKEYRIPKWDLRPDLFDKPKGAARYHYDVAKASRAKSGPARAASTPAR